MLEWFGSKRRFPVDFSFLQALPLRTVLRVADRCQSGFALVRSLSVSAMLLAGVAVALMLFIASSGSGSLAVHDQDFQLDGDTSPVDVYPPSPGDPTIDWEHLFDVPALPAAPTPKATLPGNFKMATFIRDFVPGETGPDLTTYTTGSKDTLNISTGWECTGANKPSPPKDDILNAYAALSANGDTIIYFGFERFKNNGDANVGFWLLQDPTVGCTAIDPPGTGGGSTASFTGDHVDGDLLVVSEFTNGGVVSTINVYEWVGGAGGSLNPAPVASAADCKTTLAGDLVCATTNGPTQVFTPPWLTQTDETPSTQLGTSEFFEGGLNLSALNVEACFSTFMAVTRASTSLTAALHDFALGGFQLCGIEVTKSGTDLSKVGDDVDYTITIENTGAIALFKDDITDTLFGDIVLNGVNQADPNAFTSFNFATATPCGLSLAPGNSCTVEVTRTVQPGDPDPLPNTVTVVYNASDCLCSAEATSSGSHSVELFEPSIAVTKTGDELSKVGDDVNYDITLSNNSSANTPALTCTATDTLLGVLFGPDAVLPPGDTPINVTHTIAAGDDAADGNADGSVDNTVTLSCTVAEPYGNQLEAEASHSVNLFQPSIEFSKTGDELSKVGDEVDYTITLDNTSSEDTPDLECTITDALLGIDEDVTLASGGQHVINASRTVLVGDPDPLVNTAEVTCSPIDFPNVLTASDSHSVNLFQPALTLAKACAPAAAPVGGTVTYTFTITNTSSDDSPDLERVSVTDSLLGDVAASFPASLAPGASATVTLTRDLQSADADPLVNTVEALYQVAGFPNQLVVSDSCSVDITPTAVLPQALPETGSASDARALSDLSLLLGLGGLALLTGTGALAAVAVRRRR